MGSTLPSVCWMPSSGMPRVPPASSDVEEAHVLGVLLDEVTTGLDVVTHEGREDLVGDRRVRLRDLEQCARRLVHRRGAELVPVHLAQALEPHELELATLVLGLEAS